MTFLYKIGSAWLAVLLLLLACAPSVSAAQAKSDTETIAEIDDYVAANMKANHITGASLAITRGSKAFYTHGYGTVDDGRAITAATLFPIASLSKSFTALAVLQLVAQGRVGLDAPYISYFPELSPADDRVGRITVRQLLNQTSGLTDKANPDMTRAAQYQSLQQIAASLNTVKLAAEPGSGYSYHNPNYQFLALLVQRISGQSYADYVREHIFTPLGMSSTTSIGTTQQIGENAAIPRGHYVLLGKSVAHQEPAWFIEGPAGIVSTADDMAKWMLAQVNGEFLPPELMEQYHAAGQIGSYGMGWLAANSAESGRTISHSGILWTYKAEETIFLDRQLGIAMMFDTGINAFVDYAAFVEGIARIMDGGKAEASIVNGGSLETFMMVLIAATVVWGWYSVLRLRRMGKRAATPRKLVPAAVRTAIPLLLLLFMPQMVSFVGGGRVVPWFGIWMTMPSLLIWLAVLSLVQLCSLACRIVQLKKR